MIPQTVLGPLVIIKCLLVYIIIFECNLFNFIILATIIYILITMIRGSEQSFLYIASGGYYNKPNIKIEGFVKPGYEKVKQEFEKNFNRGMERGAQLAVYVKGELVVNLWGTFDTENYDQNTIQRVYSSSKNITSLVIAMLVDRGLLDYQEKVVKYWPEFGQNGKENVRIVDILRHESGLQSLPGFDCKFISKGQIRKNTISNFIEGTPQNFPQYSNRCYHGQSRGLILNEIIRRVDPKKRTIGEFLEEEIRQPLGLNLYIGVPLNKLGIISDLIISIKKNRLWAYLQAFVPKYISDKTLADYNFLKMMDYYFRQEYNQPGALSYQNTINIKQGEAPSSNCFSNALSLAKIGNVIVNKGKTQDQQLFSEKTFDLMHQDPVVKLDCLFFMKTKFNQGGFNVYDKEQDLQKDYEAEGFIGWQGLGGSIMQWHNEEQIAIGYAMNLMDPDYRNSRGFKLKAKVWECVQNIKKIQ